MLLPRLQPPLRAALISIARSATAGGTQTGCLNEAFAQLAIKPMGTTFVRYAHHSQQRAVNKAKDGPGKRLGAKKSGEQYVIPGNIIFRQRGTHWFPGDNCGMGRDHTIYATAAGYVKYYKDPEKNPKRQYIGVVFERDQVLPLPRNSMRRRRLDMVAVKMETPKAEETDEVEEAAMTRSDLVEDADGKVTVKTVRVVKKTDQGGMKKVDTVEEKKVLTIRPGYMYREANWEIGRAAEKAKIKVREFKPRDRWVAWRKARNRKAVAMEKKNLSRKLKKK